MSNLGSAGCRNSYGVFCSFCEKTHHRFFCTRHFLDLDTTWSGEPYRAGICCDDALQHWWSKILKNKKKEVCNV